MNARDSYAANVSVTRHHYIVAVWMGELTCLYERVDSPVKLIHIVTKTWIMLSYS